MSRYAPDIKLNGKKARLPQPAPQKAKKDFGGEPVDLVIGFLSEMRSKNQMPKRLVNVIILLRSAFPGMSINNMLMRRAYEKAGWDIGKLSTLTNHELAKAIESGELGQHYDEPALRVEPVKPEIIRTYVNAQHQTKVRPQLPTPAQVLAPGAVEGEEPKGMANFLKDPPPASLTNNVGSSSVASTSQKTNSLKPSTVSKEHAKAALGICSSTKPQQGLSSSSSHKETKGRLAAATSPALTHLTTEDKVVNELKLKPDVKKNLPSRTHKAQLGEKTQGAQKQGTQGLAHGKTIRNVGQLSRGGSSNRCGASSTA